MTGIPAEGTVPSAPVGDLSGWKRAPFTGADRTYDCFEKGSGPGVVLIPEVPGVTPEVLGLGEHLVDEGFTVVIPSPFGTPGAAGSTPYKLGVIAKLCVSAEFRAFALGAHRPITDYFRAVATDLDARTPGTGVGVIGMCFTGSFALATAVDTTVVASVLSQPVLPLPLGSKRRADPGLSEEELDRVSNRAADSSLCVLGLRFSGDGTSPAARFATLKSRLGDAFEVIELNSSPGNPAGFTKDAHSVLTSEVREIPGHPALVARQRMVDFLRARLGPAQA